MRVWKGRTTPDESEPESSSQGSMFEGFSLGSSAAIFRMVHLVRDRLQTAVVGRERLIDESVLELHMATPGPVSKRYVCRIDLWVKSEMGFRKCSAMGM